MKPAGNSARLRAQALTEMARMKFNQQRYEEALPFFDQAAAADPSFLRARVGKAHTLKMLGRAAEALAIIDAVIAENPAYPLAHSTRGSALQALGKIDEAREAYERALELDPANALVHYNFACFSALRGDAAETRRHLELALKYDPRQNTNAAVDPDFDRFRHEAWFEELIAFK